ncbi:MAG: transmembrane anchor protein, partial [Parahaliea sp.]
MYNANQPDIDQLPGSGQLLRSTFSALAIAIAILVAVVLPAEYAIDPTGIGQLLGLTEMGEIKSQLAGEAAADAARAMAGSSGDASAATPVAPVPPGAKDAVWRDQLRVSLPPGQGVEVKLVMQSGAQASYSWQAEGGVVTFDAHGDG